MKKIMVYLFKYLSIVIITFTGLSAKWYLDHYSGTSIEEMIFTLKAPLDGMEAGIMHSFRNSVILPLVLILIACILMIEVLPGMMLPGKSKKSGSLHFNVGILVFPLLFIFSFYYSLAMYNDLNLTEYIKNQFNATTIYEDYYTDPSSANLSFPDSKPNLIHIFLESIETTYTSKESGGAYDYNLIPNLTEIAQTHVSFSASDKLTGGYTARSTHFTMGALLGHTAGIPLTIPIHGNSYSGYGKFLPGAYSLGDLLEEEGYNQVFSIGSDAEFGGRKDYFTYHGGYEIYDYNYAIDHQLIPEDYMVWWGFEDKKLYSFAKDQLSELSQSDQPFNFTMLTADTHHIGGYKCELCEDEYPDQYSNVIRCADRQVNDFINWIKEQDFYDHTVIVITGDHNSMDPDYFSDLPDDYRRAPYNAIINAQTDYTTSNLKFRTFYAMDWYPTVLGAMGVEIEGDRLGLGTNMFSERQTLMEELGAAYLMNELMKTSRYYNNHLLFPDN